MPVRAALLLRSLSIAATLTVVAIDGGLVEAQALSRLKGRVVHDAGGSAEPTEIRVEAIYGFLGGDFTGQRTFTVAADAKGDWALLAFKAGVWVFDAWTPGRLPDAIALPFNVGVPQASGVAGDMPPWHPILHTTPVPATPAGETLARAAEAAHAGKVQDVTALLARVADSNDVDVLNAAGRICLLLRDAKTARPFFRRALERDPQSFGAALGMGSTALMQRDFDAAGRAFAQARERTKDRDERSYLTAAIGDINKVSVAIKRAQ